MSYLLTHTAKGGDIKLYPEHLVVAYVKDKVVYFLSLPGINTQKRVSLKYVKKWLAEHGIKFFHIAKHKIGCEPHIVGGLDDDSLVYNAAFYLVLHAEAKDIFNSHSMDEYYRKRWLKGCDDYKSAKDKAVKPKGAEDDNPGNENDNQSTKNDSSGIYNDT